MGRIQPNLLHRFPSWLGYARATFFSACVSRPSICQSRYLLLNHWADFNQTCYITYPHGKGVQEQHYFSVCPFICPSRYLLLNHRPEFNQTCYITFPHGKGVRKQYYISIFLSGNVLSRYLLLNHWLEFNQTCYMASPHGKNVEEQVHPFIMLKATLARSVGICDGTPSSAHSSFLIS